MKRAAVFFNLAIGTVVWLGLTLSAEAAPLTSTVLASSASTVTAGSPVTLTATVRVAGNPVTPGLVIFCDAAAASCQGPAILGTGQLTAGGTASIKFVFGAGQRSIVAVFAGTSAAQSSVSAVTTIEVTGSLPTTTTMAASGSAGNYTLTATLGYHGLTAPGSAESVNFFDTSDGNLSLGAGSLTGLALPDYSFITIPSSPVATGSFPASQVIADFNGDGFPDIAVANYLDNTVSVFAGDGMGGFTAMSGSPITVGNHPTALATADVNGDGLPDLLVVNAGDANVSVLLATLNGFTLQGEPTVGNGPQAIAVADFNQDGNADLAVANLLDSTISILLGDGTGTFTLGPTVSAYTGNNPNALVAADFNQDGMADLAIADTSDGTITVLQGDGNAGFAAMPGSPFTVASNPVALSAGDFNGDLKFDLAILSASNNNLSILLNTGGGFSAPAGSPYATGASPDAIVVGDFNADGKEDLAIANGNENTVTVLQGDGGGGFAPASQSPLANFSAPMALAWTDLNGDGTEDLVVSNIGGNSFSVRPLQITQAATATLSSVAVPGGGTHLVAASFAGDSIYTGSSATPVSLAGSLISTTLSLSVSPGATVLKGAALQLTALLTATSSSYSPGGTVSFFDGSNQIGQTTLSNGQAVVSLSSLTVGAHSLHAVYSGDSNFGVSTSSIQPATVTDFGVAVTPATMTVSRGSSGSFQISITPMSGGFASPISFALSGLPTGATGTFSPATVTPGGNAASTTLSISASNQVARSGGWLHVSQLAIAMLLLPIIGIPIVTMSRTRNSTSARVLKLLLVIVMLAGAGALTSCGNRGLSGGTSRSFSLTITASSGSLSHATTATLNVQ